MTDLHSCKLSDGPKPHVGGPITKGSTDVQAGHLFSARMSDQATCVSPAPNAVMMGSPTVLINHLPAARKGDITLHGGSIEAGEPTVDIGMGAFPYPIVFDPKTGKMRIGNHLVIEGNPEFQGRVLGDLGDIAMTPSSDPNRAAAGRTTLDSLNNGKHDVTITQTSKGNGYTPSSMADAQNPAKGTGGTVKFNPTAEPPTHADPKVNRPADVGLHHELAHADHGSQGKIDLNKTKTPGFPHVEEENTIRRDNLFRDDRGIPQRKDHSTL